MIDPPRGQRPPGDLKVVVRSLSELKSNSRNARTHSRRQIRQIADSMAAFGFNNPVLVDEDGLIIAGHGRIEAAKLLGLTEVPTVCLSHMSEAEKRAYVIADNRLAEKAGWPDCRRQKPEASLKQLRPCRVRPRKTMPANCAPNFN